MIPIRDDVPARRFPAATLVIIGINAWVFLQELALGRRLGQAFFEWGLVPARYTNAELADQFGVVEQVAPFFSSMFLHGGWIHLIGNMWILWIFGDNVEDQLGRLRFVALYLLSGVAAAILHVLANANSVLPAIGASGAVAGVMGAYVLLFPRARVATLIPPFILGPYFMIPAVVYLGWWFVLQFFNGALELGTRRGQFGSVAWWEHVGGFVFGLVACLWLRPRRPPPLPPPLPPRMETHDGFTS